VFRPSEEGANVTTRRSLAVRRQQLARPEGDLDRESHPGNNNEGPGEALFRTFKHFSAPNGGGLRTTGPWDRELQISNLGLKPGGIGCAIPRGKAEGWSRFQRRRRLRWPVETGTPNVGRRGRARWRCGARRPGLDASPAYSTVYVKERDPEQSRVQAAATTGQLVQRTQKRR